MNNEFRLKVSAAASLVLISACGNIEIQERTISDNEVAAKKEAIQKLCNEVKNKITMTNFTNADCGGIGPCGGD